MTDNEFSALMARFAKYLEMEKVFIKNPKRFADVEHATEIATRLFPKANISLNDDPLQMGALIVRIEDYSITIRGAMETELFQELISKADNFEIYPIEDDNVRMAILFSNALIRISPLK